MYCYGVVEMIYARVFETKLICDYCDHNGNKRNNNIGGVVTDNRKTLEFDKTITKCNNSNINNNNKNSNNMMRNVKKLN